MRINLKTAKHLFLKEYVAYFVEMFQKFANVAVMKASVMPQGEKAEFLKC